MLFKAASALKSKHRMKCYHRASTFTLQASSRGFALQRSGELGVPTDDLGTWTRSGPAAEDAMSNGNFVQFKRYEEEDDFVISYAETPVELSQEARRPLEAVALLHSLTPSLCF